jgi:hypothetical protein
MVIIMLKIVDMTEYLSQNLLCLFFCFEKYIPNQTFEKTNGKSEKTQAHQDQIFFSFNSTNTYYGILIVF